MEEKEKEKENGNIENDFFFLADWLFSLADWLINWLFGGIRLGKKKNVKSWNEMRQNELNWI